MNYFGAMIQDNQLHKWNISAEDKQDLIAKTRKTDGAYIIRWIEGIVWPMASNVWVGFNIVKVSTEYKLLCRIIQFNAVEEEFYYMSNTL